jgi:8-oxo-dGTP pyrophosphatase MutT (NUDIX family)
MTKTILRKAGWVHVQDQRLLCARSHGKTLFYVPGGKPESGENMETALRREIMEELGIALVPGLLPLGVIAAPADGRDDMLVEISLFGGDPLGKPAPCAEIVELRWLSAADAPLASAATARLLVQLKADHVID